MKLRVALVGCGHISRIHLRAWRRLRDATVAGVFDLDQDLAAARAKEFSIPTVFSSLDQAIDACDVVDVCTPPGSHAQIALQVVETGRHLLVEKPVVTELDDWLRIRKAAEASTSSITVVHNIKFAPSVRKAKKWVDDGRLGNLLRLHRRFLTSPESDRMLSGDAHWSHRLAGGRWAETLPHELYLIHSFLGPLRVDHVLALSTPSAPVGAPADEVLVVLSDGSRIATIEYSASCRLNRRSLSLYGTDGVLDLDILSGVLTLSKFGRNRWSRAPGIPFLDSISNATAMIPDRLRYLQQRLLGINPHSVLIADLVDHLEGRSPAPTPLEEIDYVVRTAQIVGNAIEQQLEPK